MGGIVESVSGILFGQKAPKIPEAKVPAVPAPSRRQDTGAQIVLGADATKDARVSGNKNKVSSDVLGSIGRGGLQI